MCSFTALGRTHVVVGGAPGGGGGGGGGGDKTRTLRHIMQMCRDVRVVIACEFKTQKPTTISDRSKQIEKPSVLHHVAAAAAAAAVAAVAAAAAAPPPFE